MARRLEELAGRVPPQWGEVLARTALAAARDADNQLTELLCCLLAVEADAAGDHC